MYHPVFLSGPHGGGKSTLIAALLRSSRRFIENDFDIDFTVDFPSIASLSSFERSLMRLYHRFFIAHYALELAKRHPEKIVLTNRTVYDSEAYINTYQKLRWITEGEFKKLHFGITHFAHRPYAVVLNPPLEVLTHRLNKRKRAATRTARDRIFKKEDSFLFLKQLHAYFTTFKKNPRVLYLENDGPREIKQIISWAQQLKR